MEIIRGYQGLSRSLNHPVVTIGNFDGVHLGHQRIIERAVTKARGRDGTAVAYTFRPHPQQALKPGVGLQLLATYDEKLRLLERQGLDLVIEEPFSRDFSGMSAELFFTDVILRRVSAEGIVVGYDFGFGSNRQGTLDILDKMCGRTGVELEVVPPLKVGNEVVSSSRIRQYLLSGNVGGAASLLGYEFAYRGVVVHGEGRGRKLGFPTANLKLDPKLALPFGVYASYVSCETLFPGQRIPSVTNVGVRPTFQEDRELPALVETHLLDFDGDLYGNSLEVRFVRRLREEKRFPGIDSLKAQIRADSEEARAVLI